MGHYGWIYTAVFVEGTLWQKPGMEGHLIVQLWVRSRVLTGMNLQHLLSPAVPACFPGSLYQGLGKMNHSTSAHIPVNGQETSCAPGGTWRWLPLAPAAVAMATSREALLLCLLPALFFSLEFTCLQSPHSSSDPAYVLVPAYPQGPFPHSRGLLSIAKQTSKQMPSVSLSLGLAASGRQNSRTVLVTPVWFSCPVQPLSLTNTMAWFKVTGCP